MKDSNFLMEAFNIIGNNGPIILTILSIILLIKKSNLLFYYIIFNFLSIIINLIIKGIIQEPRPSIDKKTFNSLIKNKEKYYQKNGLPFNIFGMPSGHAQGVFYSTVFIYLVFNNIKLTLFYLFISLLTLFQRVFYNHHTVLQVIVGSLVGLSLGILAIKIARTKIKGKLTLKKDDFAFF